MTENWKAIPGFDGDEVSDLGRVHSFRCHSGNRRESPRLMAGYVDTSGYRHTTLRKATSKHTVKIHRLVLSAFVGPRPDGMEARHLNGDRDDNRLSNLCWGTKSENSMDSVRHGTPIRGESHPGAKLDNTKIRQIRRLRSDGLSYAKIGRQHGVSVNTIWKIINGKNWKHVDG